MPFGRWFLFLGHFSLLFRIERICLGMQLESKHPDSKYTTVCWWVCWKKINEEKVLCIQSRTLRTSFIRCFSRKEKWMRSRNYLSGWSVGVEETISCTIIIVELDSKANSTQNVQCNSSLKRIRVLNFHFLFSYFASVNICWELRHRQKKTSFFMFSLVCSLGIFLPNNRDDSFRSVFLSTKKSVTVFN